MNKKSIIAIGSIILIVVFLVMGRSILIKKQRLQFVEQMGNGINLGNALDATNLWDYKPEVNELEYETFWENPSINVKQFEAIYNAGFRTVRIPVTWEDHLNEEENISEVWMNRVQQVVDMAHSQGLYVIINTHHETWLNTEIAKEEEITKKLEKVWVQIATRFSEYDDYLLFEGINEPRLRDSDVEWTEGTSEMRSMVNRLNTVFIKTVRSVPGNEKRYLLIGGYGTGNFPEILENIKIPKGNIIISVHIYLPYDFCQNTQGKDAWHLTNLDDTREITAVFENLERLFIKKGIPVIMTEFGCLDKDNLKDRLEWTEFYINKANEIGIACIWWDNGSDFQLLDRGTNQWTYKELVDVLVV